MLCPLRPALRLVVATASFVAGGFLVSNPAIAAPLSDSSAPARRVTPLPRVDPLPEPDGDNSVDPEPDDPKPKSELKRAAPPQHGAAVIASDAPGATEPEELSARKVEPLPPLNWGDADADAPADQDPEEIEPGQDEPSVKGPGMGGPGIGGFGMGGPGMRGPGYSAVWYPTTDAMGEDPGETLGLVRQRLNAGAPLWTNGKQMALVSVLVQNSMFQTDAILPQSGQPFPDNLWNINFGLNYLHPFENGWTGMAGINFGSASNQPFHSIDEMTLGTMSFLRVPARNERDAWMFALMYSPVGNVNFPIPGLAYQWNRSETFQASIGIPFSMVWRPFEKLTINMTYMPIINGSVRVSYQLTEDVCTYGAFESCQEVYLLADRVDLNDRFMGFEQRLHTGVQWAFWKKAVLDTSAGYAFDRYYGIGQNQISGASLQDRINIGSGAFLSSSMQIRF